MCGIAGVIAWSDRFRITRPSLMAMSACLAHRGPDAEGIWINHEIEPHPEKAQVGLAHRRLAVIDLDPRANQPFTDQLGRWIVFNGEIYNFRELRTELTALKPDYPWRTECDTEVLLAAYAAWGEKCVDHLNGMFAFAVWDERAQSLFLARDRMGQKPLYYTFDDCGAAAFASELTAVLKPDWVEKQINPQALADYLRWGYINAPDTIYENIYKLPPGSWMRVTRGRREVQEYFDPNGEVYFDKRPSPQPSPGVPGEGENRTRQLVIQAVRRQLVSDVPLGCFLSGGIDSSIIAAAMKAAVGNDQPVLTFSIGFEDRRYDETRYAAEIAEYLRTQHRQFIVKPNAAEDLPRLAATFGEPFGDSSALPTHYLARETRKHVTVALSGDGGDELFAGYDRYRAMRISAAFDRLSAPLKAIAVSKLWQRVPANHPKNPITRAKRLLEPMGLPPAQRYTSYLQLFPEPMLQNLFAPGQQRQSSGQDMLRRFEQLMQDRDAVEAAMALDRVTYLPGDLLFKVDACSMLHALEVRSPFMDHELVRFAAGLQSHQLLGGGFSRGKRLLRQAFANDLPAAVFRRKKMGFAVPIGDWLRTSLRPMLRDLLFAADSFAAKHFNRHAIDRLVSEHENRRADHGQQLYALLMLELWHRSTS